MNNKIVFGIGGIIIGLVIAIFFTTTISPYSNAGFGMMGWRSNSGSNQGLTGNTQVANNIDRHFIEQMIPHHDGAVAMAKLALEKSKRTEIKTLATAIIEGQTKEIQDMEVWYKDWFGKDVPQVSTGMMGGGMMSSSGMHMGGQEDMTVLENAKDFDKAFLEAMIPHHQLALMMVRMLEAGSNRPEMLQLAKNITNSQSKEIQQMQAWYVQWYK
ncbi:MAG: hypothetical protein AB201_02080 [Parcubacteria bacterium C7867-006]|nr:MAG: hypothetical protein AB201_02080 [Parcubacteria bacterium C7867-006]